jgi:predicted HTH domain antitoxin
MSTDVKELVEAGIYPDADAAVEEALRVLWQERPDVRIKVAVHRYQLESLSVAKAASIAGVSFDRMKEILSQRGISIGLGPTTVAEAREEFDNLQQNR